MKCIMMQETKLLIDSFLLVLPIQSTEIIKILFMWTEFISFYKSVTENILKNNYKLYQNKEHKR